MMGQVYAAVADAIWEFSIEEKDTLVARLAAKLQTIDPNFNANDFKYRAYRI